MYNSYGNSSALPTNYLGYRTFKYEVYWDVIARKGTVAHIFTLERVGYPLFKKDGNYAWYNSKIITGKGIQYFKGYYTLYFKTPEKKQF